MQIDGMVRTDLTKVPGDVKAAEAMGYDIVHHRLAIVAVRARLSRPVAAIGRHMHHHGHRVARGKHSLHHGIDIVVACNSASV